MARPSARRGRRSSRRSNRNPLVPLTRELITLNRAQITYAPPAVPDPIPMQIRRNKVHTFVVNSQGDTVVTSTTVDTLGSYCFALQPSSTNIQGPSNTTEFTSLFDQWRITEVTMEVHPDYTTTDTNLVLTVIDLDDNTAPTLMSQLRQYGTIQSNSINGQFFSRTLHPLAADNVYNGAFGGFGSRDRGSWIDVASPGTQYYGIKFGVGPAAAVNHLRIEFRIVFQFRNNR